MMRLWLHSKQFCATLHFVDEKAAIYLQTDVSQYGIGAYLFQTLDGAEKPVAFLSKTLDKTQLKWTTIEKEGYAIYYAFINFDTYLEMYHLLYKQIIKI